MKHFIITLFVTALLSIGSAQATECETNIQVKINGLVCDFCAQALEKVFSKSEEVSGIKVDLDRGVVDISLNPGQTLDDKTITEFIKDSGYDITDIKRAC